MIAFEFDLDGGRLLLAFAVILLVLFVVPVLVLIFRRDPVDDEPQRTIPRSWTGGHRWKERE